MAKHESAWKTMLNFYKAERAEEKAPMMYQDVWLKTKSHQRLILGLTDSAKAELTTVTTIDWPSVGTELAAGDPLVTLHGATTKKVVTTPFSGTVTAVNADLNTNPSPITTNVQKDNWLVKLRAQ